MAIRPLIEYPGQTAAGDAGYPLGKAQNQSVSGDGTGTPLEAGWVNDTWGFQQALLAAVGATASGEPDKVGASDYLNALQALINGTAGPLNTRLAALENALATEGEFTVALPLRALPIVAQGNWVRRSTFDFPDQLEGSDSSRIFIPLAGFVPRGATVTKVEAFVNTAAHEGTDRMNLAYCTQSFGNLVSPANANIPRTTSVRNVYADAAAGDQTIVMTGNSTLNESGHYLVLKASSVAAPLSDTLKGLRLTYTRSGL